jgi:AcrR family transcriptional regulator
MGIAERREREKEQRRNDIIDAAEKVFFEKGYAEATMDDISDEVELSKGTVYLYFNTKEELYFAVMIKGFNILVNLFKEAAEKEKSGADKLRAIGEAYIRFFKEYNADFRNLMFFEGKHLDFDDDSPWVAEFEKVVEDLFSNLTNAIKNGISDGSIRKDIEPVKMSLLLWAQTNGVLQLASIKRDMLECHFHVTPDELIGYYIHMLGGMFGSAPPPAESM